MTKLKVGCRGELRLHGRVASGVDGETLLIARVFLQADRIYTANAKATLIARLPPTACDGKILTLLIWIVLAMANDLESRQSGSGGP